MYQLYVIEKETIIMEDIQSVVTIKELYSLDQTMAKPLLEKLTYPWEALPLIKDFVLELGKSLDKDEYNEVDEHVWIHKSCKVYGTATILGPTIIGAGTEVRPGAFIRGSVLVGENCVVIQQSSRMSSYSITFRFLITTMWEIQSSASSHIWVPEASRPM